MEQKEIIEEVRKSGLRGRGGAGSPTGMKWMFASADPKFPKYLICNADEGELGTFKDRPILEKNPHLLIEGMVISAYALKSEYGYIYLRGEYPHAKNILNKAIKQAYEKGYLGENILGKGIKFHLSVHQGAGAYICGEETALIESLEGRRGHPRTKPPFPVNVGASLVGRKPHLPKLEIGRMPGLKSPGNSRESRSAVTARARLTAGLGSAGRVGPLSS